MLRDIQSVEVLVCNRALIILIAVSELPLKLKLYVSLWTSGRCAEQLSFSKMPTLIVLYHNKIQYAWPD